jgi:hypothetical protein
MAGKVNILRNLRVREGSLVDNPANQDASVVFFKRHTDAAEGSMSTFASLLKSLGVADDVAARVIKAHTDEVSAETAKLDAAKVTKVDPHREPTEIEKRLTTELDVVRKALDVEVEKREQASFVEIAKGYKHLPMAAADLGTVLRVVSKLDAKVGDKSIGSALDTFLKAADAQIAAGGLTNEVGTGRADGSGLEPMGAIEQAAAAEMKADPKLSKHAAIAKALDKNPKLYNDYETDRSH